MFWIEKGVVFAAAICLAGIAAAASAQGISTDAQMDLKTVKEKLGAMSDALDQAIINKDTFDGFNQTRSFPTREQDTLYKAELKNAWWGSPEQVTKALTARQEVQEFSRRVRSLQMQTDSLSASQIGEGLKEIPLSNDTFVFLGGPESGGGGPPQDRTAYDWFVGVGPQLEGFAFGPDVSRTLAHPEVGVMLKDRGADWVTAICTATLISPRVVLTAAHCLCDGKRTVDSCRESKLGRFQRTVGSHQLFLIDDLSVAFQGMASVQIEAVSLHPAYARPKYDVALAFLAEPVVKTVFARFGQQANGERKPLFLFGFGGRNRIGEPRKAVKTPGIKTAGKVRYGKCSATLLARNGLSSSEFAMMRCQKFEFNPGAFSLASQTRSCKGDSGGAILDGKSSDNQIVAIVNSGVMGDCSKDSVVVNTDLSFQKIDNWLTSAAEFIEADRSTNTVHQSALSAKNLAKRGLLKIREHLLGVSGDKKDFVLDEDAGSLHLTVNTSLLSERPCNSKKCAVHWGMQLSREGTVLCSRLASRKQFEACKIANPKAGRYELKLIGSPAEEDVGDLEFQALAVAYD